MNEAFTIASRIASSPQYMRRNVVAGKGFTVQYLFYRIARPVLKLNYKIFKWRNPQTPWTSQAAVAIFKAILNSDMTGLEYGSGNSTLFLASHLKHLVSIEHDHTWYDEVKNSIARMRLNNVEYRLIPAALPGPVPYSIHQEHGLSEEEFNVHSEFSEYFSYVRKFPDQHFDFIMIDGRARIECALNAIPKLKSGGVFVLDNSDRRRYTPIFKVLAGWKKVTTTTGLFDTTFWFKP